MATPEQILEMADKLSKPYPETDSSYFYHATREAAAMLREIAGDLSKANRIKEQRDSLNARLGRCRITDLDDIGRGPILSEE